MTFFIVFETNFSHEKPKHELQRSFQLLQLQNLLHNCRSGVCLFSTSRYCPSWIKVPVDLTLGHKHHVCMYAYVSKYPATIDTQNTYSRLVAPLWCKLRKFAKKISAIFSLKLNFVSLIFSLKKRSVSILFQNDPQRYEKLDLY